MPTINKEASAYDDLNALLTSTKSMRREMRYGDLVVVDSKTGLDLRVFTKIELDEIAPLLYDVAMLSCSRGIGKMLWDTWNFWIDGGIDYKKKETQRTSIVDVYNADINEEKSNLYVFAKIYKIENLPSGKEEYAIASEKWLNLKKDFAEMHYPGLFALTNAACLLEQSTEESVLYWKANKDKHLGEPLPSTCLLGQGVI